MVLDAAAAFGRRPECLLLTDVTVSCLQSFTCHAHLISLAIRIETFRKDVAESPNDYLRFDLGEINDFIYASNKSFISCKLTQK